MGVVVLFVLMFASAAAAGAAFGEGAIGAGAIVGMGLALLVMLLPTVMAIVGGVRAFKGRWWSMPIIGRLAKSWLDKQEPQVLNAPPG